MVSAARYGVIAVLVCLVAEPVVARAQVTELFTIDGAVANDRFGRSLADAGDVDGDGFDDWIVGAVGASGGPGIAQVFSGQTGAVLHTFMIGQDLFGIAVDGAGDVNDDGFDDVIVGDDSAFGFRGSATVFSGATGTEIYSFSGEALNDQFGDAVSGAGDVDGDGFADLLVGAPGYDDVIIGGSDVGRVYVYSGADGNAIHTFTGTGNKDRLGAAVTELQDIDGDEFGDFAIGAPGVNLGSRVHVISGQSGAELFDVQAGGEGDRFGSYIANAGDVDGDGVNDLIAGAPQSGSIDTGYAEVFSGLTGGLLHHFQGDGGGDRFGAAVSSAGDVDGDRRADLIVGATQNESPASRRGYARVFSGRWGGVIRTFDGEGNNDWFGGSVTRATVNADGAPDLLIGASEHDGPAGQMSGKVYAYGFCVDWDGDGFGDPGTEICPFPQADCDDYDPAVNPGAAEIPGNGIDDNCNGAVDELCGTLPPGASGSPGVATYALCLLALAFARVRGTVRSSV